MSRERERVPVRCLPRRRLRERHREPRGEKGMRLFLICRLLWHSPPMGEAQEVEGGYVPDCSPSPFSPASHMSGRGKSEKGLV